MERLRLLLLGGSCNARHHPALRRQNARSLASRGHGRAECHPRLLLRRRSFSARRGRGRARACGWWRRGPRSSISAASRPGRGRLRFRSRRSCGVSCPSWRVCARPTQAIISVDTSKPEVIREAVAAGAGLINDVRALTEPGALEAAAASDCAMCLMHMQGDPRTMQRAPSYVDVVKEVKAFLDEHVQRCRAAGVSADRIRGRSRVRFRQDPGAQSRAAQAARGARTDELPMLVGLSRKSIVGTLTGRSAGERVHGSVALR